MYPCTQQKFHRKKKKKKKKKGVLALLSIDSEIPKSGHISPANIHTVLTSVYVHGSPIMLQTHPSDLCPTWHCYRGFQEGWRLSEVTTWSAVNHDNYQYSTSTQQHQCSWLTALQLVTSRLASTFWKPLYKSTIISKQPLLGGWESTSV